VAGKRCGGVQRHQHRALLVMLADAGRVNAGGSATCALPTLGDIAGIVHIAPETVSRALASLREASFLQDCSPKTAKYRKLELRTHRLVARNMIPASRVGAHC
jgi:hypothetical protein